MRGRLAASLALVLAAEAAAHWVSPDAVVAAVNADRSRAAWGVERATRDEKAPRLLVIRVGQRWYERTREARRTRAAEWYAQWRDAVEQGIVAVVDAGTERPVVGYGRGGSVVGVADGPTR